MTPYISSLQRRGVYKGWHIVFILLSFLLSLNPMGKLTTPSTTCYDAALYDAMKQATENVAKASRAIRQVGNS